MTPSERGKHAAAARWPKNHQPAGNTHTARAAVVPSNIRTVYRWSWTHSQWARIGLIVSLR
jgi:hypothetical protein